MESEERILVKESSSSQSEWLAYEFNIPNENEHESIDKILGTQQMRTSYSPKYIIYLKCYCRAGTVLLRLAVVPHHFIAAILLDIMDYADE